jgi:preprotein translocase subunit SecA
MIFHVEVSVEGEEPPTPDQYDPQQRAAAGSSTTGGRVAYSSGATAGAGAIAAAAGTELAPAEPGAGISDDGMVAVQQRKVDEHDTLGRNDPCWCGSGKKYKKCHGA